MSKYNSLRALIKYPSVLSKIEKEEWFKFLKSHESYDHKRMNFGWFLEVSSSAITLSQFETKKLIREVNELEIEKNGYKTAHEWSLNKFDYNITVKTTCEECHSHIEYTITRKHELDNNIFCVCEKCGLGHRIWIDFELKVRRL